MSTITYQLTLLSDGEIGSGLGNETVNDLVVRDHAGRPVIRGSHLKGLLRAALGQISDDRDWDGTLAALVFGENGDDGDDGVPAAIQVLDATSTVGRQSIRSITRTSLTELGVVSGATLRTTEAVSTGTVFTGSIRIATGSHPAVESAVRLALLTLGAIGGGRTRGAGACRVEILKPSENRTPGQLLKTLDALVRSGLPQPAPVVLPAAAPREAAASAVLLRLTFHALDPICCPETPAIGNNAIRAGLGIPASAVMGAVITRLSQSDPALARATAEDPRTRAWPLLPCAPADTTGELPIPVRVSLSHRMSKDTGNNDPVFKDAAIAAYDWRVQSTGSPLKGADGVLLRGSDGIALWRSGDLARIISGHAVHFDPTGNGRHNLFTVEALAPLVCSGWISLPTQAADQLTSLLAADPLIAFGKARSVRGRGRLGVTAIDWDQMSVSPHPRIFVLQTPAAIPDAWDVGRAETVLARLVRESGWGGIEELDRDAGMIQITTQASCAVRFGWNRHGLGQGIGSTRRLHARRVLLPGSVFVLKQAPTDLPQLLCRGLGVALDGDVDGRLQGFGAVVPHPGIASRTFSCPPVLETISGSIAGRLAMTWFKDTDAGLSASQIAHVAARITAGGGQAAIDYLQRQKTGRSARIWDRWSPVFAEVTAAIEKDARTTQQALRTWQDMVIARRNTENRKER